MSTVTQHGYLVIADISGYTAFVAKTELEHSQEILAELLELLMSRFQPLMTISKLEGDAVFAYAPESRLPRGETLIEFIESVYVAFRDKQVSMKQATTCTCNACRNIPTLDLKFFAHHGDYFIQHVMNTRELIGSDVNLIHRLTKNHVSETKGWRAYALFTERCLEHMQLTLEEAHEQVESYEHLPQVKTFSLDLHKRHKEIVEARRVFIDKADAEALIVCDFNVPPSVAWDWVQDPIKRNLWKGDGVWSRGDRPKGRTGSGASNHCSHGKGHGTVQVVLDWRPFEYSTIESFTGGKKQMTGTLRFEQLPDGGTRVYELWKIDMPMPRLLRRIIGKVYAKYMGEAALQRAAQLAEEDYAKSQREL